MHNTYIRMYTCISTCICTVCTVCTAPETLLLVPASPGAPLHSAAAPHYSGTAQYREGTGTLVRDMERLCVCTVHSIQSTMMGRSQHVGRL